VSSVRAWAPRRASSVEGRFDVLHTTGLTALVGREEEFEFLLRRWSRAKTGQGQVVLMSGEAGIGKSRLTAALLERVAGEPHTRLRYFCSPQHIDSARWSAAGLAYNDKPQVKMDKLDAVLAQTSTSPEVSALLAEMLSLPNDGRPGLRDPGLYRPLASLGCDADGLGARGKAALRGGHPGRPRKLPDALAGLYRGDNDRGAPRSSPSRSSLFPPDRRGSGGRCLRVSERRRSRHPR
jgi:AAA ATPase-like protein